MKKANGHHGDGSQIKKGARCQASWPESEPGIQRVEGENQLSRAVLQLECMYTHTQ